MTKICAMMIVRNEADRYLNFTIPSLLEFVDEIRVVDDASDDGTYEILRDLGCVVKRNETPMFFVHEGRARNALFDWALEGEPSHLLCIDADEVVEDGQAVRKAVENNTSVSGIWTLGMTEIWRADEQFLYERVDGQWGQRKVPVVFTAPRVRTPRWNIADRALACGREPMAVAKAGIRGRVPMVSALFHLGWSCKSDREERFQRYMVHDKGQFHRDAHLQSIMFDDSRVQTVARPWPESLSSVKSGLLDRINR